MGTPYVIEQGDTLSFIAGACGMTWKALYDHPENAAFRRTHPDPNKIRVGDIIMLPGLVAGHYEVPGMKLIAQQDSMACWYASAQMLVKWKEERAQQSFADLMSPEFDAECRRLRDAGGGILNPAIMAMAKRLGLVPVPPMTPTPGTIQQWLEQYGPLWVNGKTHIVVIAGIRGLKVKVYDPWPVNKGTIDWRSLRDWYVGGKNPVAGVDSSRDVAASVEAVFLRLP